MALPVQPWEWVVFKTVRMHIDSHVEFEGHRSAFPTPWGERIGVACAATVQKMLERQPHPEHAWRACLGLLSLSRRYGDYFYNLKLRWIMH